MMAMTRAVAALLVAAISVVAEMPEVSGEQGVTGTVTGVVKLTAAQSAPLAASPYGRRGIASKQGVREPETRNVIVYVQGLKPAAPPAPMRARITQRDEQFVPQVTAITVGSTVDFPNDDPFFHNVFSLSKAKTFDLGRYPSGTSRAEVFDRPGVVKVFCHLHSHMTALIMVFEHPWFTIPAENGAFTLPPVPARELTVVAWHERIGERRERMILAPGGTARMSFTLPVLESPP
jgi:plastocyanin